MTGQRPTFVSEKLRPVPGSGDLAAMARGEPGVPSAFLWRDQRFEVARIVTTRKLMGEDRGDVYTRRHYYEIETGDALRMTIYFDRNPTDRRDRKQWWLYTLSFPDPQVVTVRLTLRRWTWADRDAFHHMVSDPDIMRYVHDFRQLGTAEAEQALRDTIEHYRAGFGDWAVIDRETGDIMGECGLTHPQVVDDVEITWLFHPKYWGKGYALEAARGVMDYAFGSLGLRRLVAHVQSDNARSIKLLGKLGFRPEGPARDRFGQDVLRYAIEK
jgi:[ribosomal protein S5]-alanine N-acetyltransferase